MKPTLEIDSAAEVDPVAPEMPLAFTRDLDPAGKPRYTPTPCPEPLYTDNERDERAPDRRRADLEEVVSEFLRMMTANGNALQVGQRMIVLAYLAGKTDCRTHAELAERLNISAGRVSQILSDIPMAFYSLCRLKRRKKYSRL
jgi:hypothetical protein